MSNEEGRIARPDDVVQPTTLDLTDLRLTLRRNGYRPVPTKGKSVTFKKWPTICASATEQDIRRWPALYRDHTNTGILSGTVVGVDIDVSDEALSNEIESLARSVLGDTSLRRVGRAPKMLLLYRSETPFGKIETAELFLAGEKSQVEILAHGQQFIAFGIHPVTAKEYNWTHRSPLDVPADDLPTITEQQCEELVVQAEALLRRAGATAKKGESEKAQSRAKAKRGTVGSLNSAALANLAAWVPVLFQDAEFNPGAGTYRLPPRPGFEEGVSFHPDGIRDFGNEVGLTPIDAVMKFGGAKTHDEAVAELGALLGLDVEFVRDAKGLIVAASQQNVRTAIAKLDVTLSHDLFQDRLVVSGVADCGPLLDDRAMERLWLTVDERFGFRPAREFFFIVVSDAARRNSFHPVREYLEGLSWDGAPRLDRWLQTYGGADDSPYVRAVGALPLLSNFAQPTGYLQCLTKSFLSG